MAAGTREGGDVDLNSDLGEGYGHWTLGDDAALLEVVDPSTPNVAARFHAAEAQGDDGTRTVRAPATDEGVAIGAQCAYPDLVGFRRRKIDVPTPTTSRPTMTCSPR